MTPVRVTAAVLVKENKILIARRSTSQSRPLLWEFPGGKVEQGESDSACLMRELQEELGITAEIGEKIGVFPFSYPEVKIDLAVYYAAITAGIPHPHEHEQLQWVLPANLLAFDLAPADIPAAEIVSAAQGVYGL